jgi:DNA-binding response OmpR family regulator
VKILVASGDPAVREMVAITVRSLRRTLGEPVELLQAADGVVGSKAALRERPAAVILDEIMSRAGAFSVAQDLRGAQPPSSAVVVILLERRQDEWLARWSGADAWFVKPADPFALGDTLSRLLGGSTKEAV